MSEAKPEPYKVHAVRVVAKGTDVLVREYTLDPGGIIPWHRHTEVSDYYYMVSKGSSSSKRVFRPLGMKFLLDSPRVWPRPRSTRYRIRVGNTADSY